MPVLAAIVASAAGGRIIVDKPTLTYLTTGQFTITNYNSQYIYTLSSGTMLNGIVTLASANQSCIITAKSQKGVTNSTQSSCERKARESYYVITTPNGCDTCNGPCTGCRGPGTEQPAGSGQFLVCGTCGYYVEYDYTSSGYTFSSSGNEWYKIS